MINFLKIRRDLDVLIKKKDKLNENQKNLDDFISFVCKNTENKEKNSVKLPYRYKVRRVSPDEFMEGKLSELEIQALSNYPGSDGYLKDLFLLNDLTFWDDLNLNAHQTEVLGRFFIGDIVKLEIGRCKLGYTSYKDWIKRLELDSNLLSSLSLETRRVPDSSNYGRMVSSIGSSNLRAFHDLLIKKYEKYELVDYQIGIWDGRFFKSNCSGHESEKTKELSDPECGKCVKGRYKGAGYIESPIIDWKFNLIVHFDVIKANRNDKIAFRRSLQGYIDSNKPEFDFFLTDGGAGASYKNLDLVHSQGTIPLLKWMKSSQPEVVKTPKGNYFNIKYIPAQYIPDLDKFYNIRTAEERVFSSKKGTYKRTRMPNRGRENALIFVGINAITQGLTSLTAYKTGRIDLIKSPTAFRDVYDFYAFNNGFFKRYRQNYSGETDAVIKIP